MYERGSELSAPSSLVAWTNDVRNCVALQWCDFSEIGLLGDLVEVTLLMVHFFGIGTITFHKLHYYDCAACLDAGGSTLPICERGSPSFRVPEGCSYDKALRKVVEVRACTALLRSIVVESTPQRQATPVGGVGSCDPHCGARACVHPPHGSTGPSSTRSSSAWCSCQQSGME